MNYILVKENIQAAVTEAVLKDIRTVVIPAGSWELREPVLLPDGITVILWGVALYAPKGAFVNEKATVPCALATEQKDIRILGFHGATVQSEAAPQMTLCNVRNFNISGISFLGGGGLRLCHARKGTVKQLRFTDSDYGIRLEEGCRELILQDITANTVGETILFAAGDTTVWGRSPEICQCIISRIFSQTKGAPAVSVRQNAVPVENMILRDITDNTETGDCSIMLGTGEALVRDVTLRNVRSLRRSVRIEASCDGIFANHAHGQSVAVAEAATRVLCTESTESPLPPRLPQTTFGKVLWATDPLYMGETDSVTLQKALNAAVQEEAALVIPRYNPRTGKPLWEIEKTLVIPENTILVLLDAHLRMQDYTYCNLFRSEGASRIQVLGIGSACLDSGKPNGLKVKNAGRFGYGDITDNALVFLKNVKDVRLEGIRIHQSRWYGIYCDGCTGTELRDLDYYAPPILPDLGGIYLAGGCRDMTIENITGTIGADGVLMEATAKSGAGDIRDIRVSSIIANVGRCSMVRAFCHDGCSISRVRAEGFIDSSLPEQKKQPRAMVCIGQAEGWSVRPVELGELRDVSVQDVCGRSTATVEVGGKCRGLYIENIHTFSNTTSALLSSPTPETTEFILKDTQETLCAAFRREKTQLEDCSVRSVFFRCLQGSPYMRGTATSIITDTRKFVGTVINLSGLVSDRLTIRDVLAEQVGTGIVTTGRSTVCVENLQIARCGKTLMQCGSNCRLTVNGELCRCTHTAEI